MKTFKFIAFIIGSFSMIFGFNSCKKDEDNKLECCTYTYADYVDTISIHPAGTTYTTCSDGSYTALIQYSDGSTYTEKGKWESGFNWAETKTYALEQGGTCE